MVEGRGRKMEVRLLGLFRTEFFDFVEGPLLLSDPSSIRDGVMSAVERP